jgi:hypothetical protein
MKGNRNMKAKLTKFEDAVYNNSFEYYFNNVRRSDDRADKYAWAMAVKASPRLAKFAGAKP